MKCLVFRTRLRYFEAIVSGEKIVEFRRNSPFWQKRVFGMTAKEFEDSGGKPIEFPFKEEPKELMVAVFICGKRVHRRIIEYIERRVTPIGFSEQGKKDVDTPLCLAFHLGDVFSVDEGYCPKCGERKVMRTIKPDGTTYRFCKWCDWTEKKEEKDHEA